MKIVSRILFTLISCLIVFNCSKEGDPVAALPKISVDDVSAAEGDALIFTVSIDKISKDTVNFSFKTENVTTSSADYNAVTNVVTRYIKPGETSVKISISTKTDATNEPDETFKLIISDPVKCTIGDGEGIGTITNTVSAPTVVYFMKAKINGTQWTANIGGFFGAEFISNTFAGYGTDNDSQLSFVFYDTPSGAKTYGLEALGATSNANVSAYYTPHFFSAGGPTWNSQPGGSFVITSYNTTTKIAEGTFSFSAQGENGGSTITITEGSFKVPIN